MWDWALLGVVLLTALYWYLLRPLSYWQSRGVPSLPGALPAVGHMWDVATMKMGASWLHCQMYRQGSAHPAVGIYSFRQPALIVRSLDLVQSVLISDFSSFHDNPMVAYETIDPLISKNPFVLKGEAWKNMRNLLAPAFTQTRIKAMFSLIERVCQEFNKYMEKHLHEDVDVNYVTGLFTSETVAKCAFAVDGNAFIDENAEFHRNGLKMWNESIYNPFFIFLTMFFPSINKLLGKSFVPKDVEKFFISLVEQAADFRQKNPDKAPENDFLQYLLTQKSKIEGFTLMDVAAQSLTFFTDGFETTSVTVSFALYELTINPDLQDALRAEVKDAATFSFETITTLPLLERIVLETLRKYSVFSMVKECTKDCILKTEGQSYPVKKGTHVVVPAYAIHHDPQIYPDPEKFDPDRFLQENAKSRHAASFMGFGAGPRICVGNRFASCVAKAFLANVVSNYHLVKCAKTVDNMVLSPLQVIPVSEQGIWIQFEKL